MKRIAIALTLGCVVLTRVVCAQQSEPADEIREFELRVLELTNIERARNSLQPLVWHEAASGAARAHSADMQHSGQLSHTGSDGSNVGQRLERVGVTDWWAWGENVAAGQTTPEAVVEAWMNSTGHRANILNPDFTHLGVGLTRQAAAPGRMPTFWTQKFIRL